MDNLLSEPWHEFRDLITLGKALPAPLAQGFHSQVQYPHYQSDSSLPTVLGVSLRQESDCNEKNIN